MRKILVIFLLAGFITPLLAQNLEQFNDKDFRQPGKLNPALAGIQEDLFRIMTDTELGESYQFMLEGKLPLKLGSFMAGYERVFTEEVHNNMVNLTYNKEAGSSKKFKIRYGAAFQMNSKSLTIPGFDSTAGYIFRDINGEVKSVPKLEDLATNVEYFDLKLGTTITLSNLLVGISIENLLNQNVSLLSNESRERPVTANVQLGGFISPLKSLTVFPSVILSANEEEFFGRASLDITSEKLNISAAYLNENNIEDLSASIAIKFNKIFAGLRYTHPLDSDIVNSLPTFNLFFNSALFKDRELFKSDFAKKMNRIY